MALSNPWMAGVQLAPLGFSVAWWSQKTLPPLARWLTKAVDRCVETAIMRWRADGYADLMLEALDVREDLPDVACPGSAV